MENEKQMYIEECGLLFEKLGLTRMAGRAFGYLVVCDEDHVSFKQIQEALKASKGSISGTMKQLVQTGMAEAVSLPGDRKTYYRISKIKIGDMIRQRISQFIELADTLQKGDDLKNREDETSGWLTEASTFYYWIGDQLDGIIKTWENEKQKIIQQYHANKKEHST
ncbi:GbsR/MarR family transcriptional regulator [Rhodohalobacter halophilus]|uniref:GbsR/MarR family transcriptional regulator n=1 Tax=Rhodohalobacter halophilus TaxID=1812810 RepID=UPI00083F8ADE|nr:hypothetical protein [Rhodohalobacter halophilus]